MHRFFFLVITMILGSITIVSIVGNKPKAASVISAILTMLSFAFTIYPEILEPEKFEPNITLDYNSLELLKNDEYVLNAAISPDNAVIDWRSSDAETIIVDEKGNLKAIKEGTATITATITYKKTKYTDSCVIVVRNPAIDLSASASLDVGEIKKVSVITTPEGAEITWNSNNSNIVTVDNNGKIKGVNEGTAIITATMVYNNENYSADCNIVVNLPDEELNNTKGNSGLGNKAEFDGQKTDDLEKEKPSNVSLADVAWLESEKAYKGQSAKTTREENWTDCIQLGSSNLNADGNAYIIAACDQKYSKFTAEIAPQAGFDRTEEITLYIYGVSNDVQTFKKEYKIDCMSKYLDVEFDISAIDELYISKFGNYNQARIAGQYLNGYTGMGVLIRNAILYD